MVPAPPHCADCPFGGRTCGSRGNLAGDLVIVGEAPGCVSGDTLIDTAFRDKSLYPKGIPIRDLARAGNDFYVYSFDVDKRQLAIGHALRAWRTGVKPVFRITYRWWYARGTARVDQEDSVIVTANHPLLLKHVNNERRDPFKGSKYSESNYLSLADDLQPGYALQPFLTQDDTRRSVGTSHQTMRTEAVFLLEHALGIQIGRANNVHHSDHNTRNDTLSNLSLETVASHARKHLLVNNPMNDPETRVKHRAAMSTETYRSGQRSGRLQYLTDPQVRRRVGIQITDAGKQTRFKPGNAWSKSYAGVKSRLSGVQKRWNLSDLWLENKLAEKFPDNHIITSIEYVGTEDVYDIEVEQYHNFAAHGIFLHNSRELSLGLPFIGPSGKLLNETLQSTFGFDSHAEGVFVTNALFCRPTGTASKTPPQNALSACRNRLLTEVEAAPRKLILALGNSALRALSDSYKLGITKERGVVHEIDGLVVLPAFHPAFVLRERLSYAKFKADFAYAAEIYRTGVIRDPGTSAFTIATPSDADQLVATLMQEPLLAVDIETTGLDPRRDTIISVGVAWAKNQAHIFQASELKALRPLWTTYTGRLIWHNGKYDTSFLRRLGYPATVHGDTLLAKYALHEVGPFGLKAIASADLGQRDYRAELNDYLPKRGPKDFSLIPESVLNPYLATDCDNTWQLAQQLEAQIARDPLTFKLYHKLLIPASNFLVRVEARGMLVSRQRLKEVRAELQARRERVLAEIDAYITENELWDPELYRQETGARTAPLSLSPGSPKQLGWILYKQLRLRPPRGVPKNTEARTLALLPQNRLITLLLAYRSVVKLIGTYVDGIEKRLGPDDRIHSTYLLHGTTNGRLSSQDPNMQNIPRQGPIKSMFVAEPGNIMLQFDFSQIELRCLAALSRDPVMMQFFRDGKDLHNEVAASVFGPEFTKEQRTQAKHCFSGDTEVLTEHGWVRFDTYDGKMPIAQFSLPDGHAFNPANGHGNRWGKATHKPPVWDGTGTISFVVPQDFRSFDDQTVFHHEDRSTDVLVTGDHDIVYVSGNGYPRKTQAMNVAAGNVRSMVASGMLASTPVLNGTWTRVLAMAVADGSFKVSNGIKLGFIKDRKVERCRELLSCAGIQFSEKVIVDKRGTVVMFTIKDRVTRDTLLKFVTPDKDLLWRCVADIDAVAYLEEASYWDSYRLPQARGGQRALFCTTRKQTADVMQAMAVTHGIPSVLKPTPQANDAWSDQYILSYRFGGSPTVRVSWQLTSEPQRQTVYCPQVPSGAILVRRQGKVTVQGNCNFGIAYGIGAKHLAELAQCTPREAQVIIDGWKARFPKAWRYISYCRSAPARGIVLSTAFGRRRHFELITSETENAIENEASNFPISSTASDLNLVAAMSVDAWCERRGALIEQLVHDSILVECPEAEAQSVARHVVATMEAIPPKILGVDMPFVAEVEIGPSLGELTMLVLPRDPARGAVP